MIVVVGGGSSLVPYRTPRFSGSEERVLFMSRKQPSFSAQGDWIQTCYDVSDGSLAKLDQQRELRSVIWLASPDSRGLFLDKSFEDIENGLLKPVGFQTALIQMVIPQMIRQGFGRFIFAGSKGAILGDVGALLYSQFKCSQSGLSRGLAIEYGRFGITSNVINLGFLGRGMSDGVPAIRQEEFLARTSSHKAVEADDFWRVAEMALDTASLNGCEIDLDGGFR